MSSHILIDTCALIDDVTPIVGALGFLKDPVVVLKSISLEMTRLCTSPDPEKQRVGQQALFTLATLHSMPDIKIIMDDDEPTVQHPDDDLVKRAWLVKGRIFTADTMLQRKAREQQIEVIAVQQYRELLRIVTPKLTKSFPLEQDLTPGTVITIRIAKLGNKPGQGIGFLPDRRVVVVEGGDSYLGGDLQVEVTRTHRPDFGQEMIFCVPAEAIQKTEQ